MSDAAWDRVRAGRLTAVVGSIPAAPADLECRRFRCDPELAGLLGVVAVLDLPPDPLSPALRRPLAQRLLEPLPRPEPADAVLEVLRGWVGSGCLVLTRVDRLGAEGARVLGSWIAAGDVPVLLIADRITPLVRSVGEILGEGALIEHGVAASPLSTVPTDVLQVLVAAAAHDGPVELSTLVSLCHREATQILASLQGAVVRGIEVGDDGRGMFTIDPDILDEVRATTLPTLAHQLAREDTPVHHTPPGPAELASQAVAIGAWDAAARWFELVPEAREPAASLAWARGDHARARELLKAHPHDASALLGVLWDDGAFDRAMFAVAELEEPRRTLDRAALELARGEAQVARARLEVALEGLDTEAHTVAVQLLGRIALEQSFDLELARSRITQAMARADPVPGALYLLDARLALRLGLRDEAVARLSRALPALAESHSAALLAQGVAALATASPPDGAEALLGWLEAALHRTRRDPRGVAWCKRAMQVAMERLPVSDQSRTLSDLRRISLEINALEQHWGALPTLPHL